MVEVPPTTYTGLQEAADVKATVIEAFSFPMTSFNRSEAPGSKGNPILRDHVVRQALACEVDRKQVRVITRRASGCRSPI